MTHRAAPSKITVGKATPTSLSVSEKVYEPRLATKPCSLMDDSKRQRHGAEMECRTLDKDEQVKSTMTCGPSRPANSAANKRKVNSDTKPNAEKKFSSSLGGKIERRVTHVG